MSEALFMVLELDAIPATQFVGLREIQYCVWALTE